MKKLIVAVLAATALSAPAAAAELGGGRVEAIVGWDNVRIHVDGLGSDSRGGVLFGLGAGYDFAMSKTMALGVDVEASDSTTDLEETDGTDSVKLSTGRDLYAGARITGAVSDRLNVYGKVGYTNARLKGSATVGGVTESASGDFDGVRGGIGGQYSLGATSYLGLEYRYSNYEADVSRHQVAGTLGFRF